MQLSAFPASVTSKPMAQTTSQNVALMQTSPLQAANRFGQEHKHDHKHDHAHHEVKTEPQGFFSKLMQGVTNFFKALFGKKTDETPQAKPPVHDHKHGEAHDDNGHVCGTNCPVHG